MAVFEYEKAGEKLFGARVKKRHGLKELQREKRGFRTRPEATRAESRLEREILAELIGRENDGSSLGELLGDWELALRKGIACEKPVQATTIQDNVNCLHLHGQHLLSRPAKHISRSDVLGVLRKMADDGKSSSRRRHLVSAVNGLYRWAIEHGQISGVAASPALGISVSRKEERKQPILNRSEIVRLLNAARLYGHEWYPIWLGALLTGMRSGELMGLMFSDLDLENRKLTVARTYNGRLKAMKGTKGGYWREVPINENLARLLKEMRASAGGRLYVFPRLLGWERGEQAKTLRAFCEGIGIPSVNFHALRACFATQLLRDRVPAAVVMKICGWTELKTMQRYIRLAGIEIEGATDTLDLITPKEAMARVVPLTPARSS